MSIESAIPSNHLILCLPLLFLPSIFPSIRVFSKGSALHITWPNYWSFSISPSMNIQNWFPVSLVWSPCSPRDSQESSSTPQFKSISSPKLSFLYSPTLTLYMTTGKTIVLTWRTFGAKVLSLLFNMLSRLGIAFLSRNKCLLISWLQSPSSVNLEPQGIKSATVPIVAPSICHEVMGPWSSFFECWVLNQLFHSPLSLSSRVCLVCLHFLP